MSRGRQEAHPRLLPSHPPLTAVSWVLLLLAQSLALVVGAAALADNPKDAGQCFYLVHPFGLFILNQKGEIIEPVVPLLFSFNAAGDLVAGNLYVKTFLDVNR